MLGLERSMSHGLQYEKSSKRAVYRVFPEYGSSPVWDDEGEVDLEDLPLSEGLRSRLTEWRASWERLFPSEYARHPSPEEAKWRKEGAELSAQLEAELGSGSVVLYEA